MRINRLTVSNFRGIKEADITFPESSRLLCLIGPGDSTKSTILTAIEWALWSTWSLTVLDTDFYRCDTGNPIVITVTVSELTERVLKNVKFELYLRKPGVDYVEDADKAEDDDPEDGGPYALSVRLTVDADLEPIWEAVRNGKEPLVLTQNDRRLFSVGDVGENCSRDLSWGRFSALQKYENMDGALRDARNLSLRAVSTRLDFSEFDAVNLDVHAIGELYGVRFDGDISSRLQPRTDGSFAGSVSLFDEDVPMYRKGTGSQRLLSMGLNISKSRKEGVILIDEVESGLEPYRLCSLIGVLRSEHSGAGQVITTTHSPVAVAECTVSEIAVVRSDGGKTTARSLLSGDGDRELDGVSQGMLRGHPEAFLCRKIVVCEGATEIGLVRAMDKHLSGKDGFRIACRGVGYADGRGRDSAEKFALRMKELGYGVAVLMDSDVGESNDAKAGLRAEGIKVFDWGDGKAFEDQLFADLPSDVAERVVDAAVAEKGADVVYNAMRSSVSGCRLEEGKILLDYGDGSVMKQVGAFAKRKAEGAAWFKRIDLGESVGDVVFGNLERIGAETGLRKTLDGLIGWVKGENDDRGEA